MINMTIRAILLGTVLALLFIALRDLHLVSHTTAVPASTSPITSVDDDLRHRSYRAAVQAAKPSVVSVRTAVPSQNGADKMQVSLGSGVVLSSDGVVVTNYHVVRGAEAIAVELSDGQTVRARLIGSDAATDLAVIKVDGIVLKPIAIAREPARVGDLVLAIGYPFLLGQTVTQGIISATERLERGLIRLIQTDAAINKGNSGGALVNTDGELVGINSAQLGTQGIGFAIPADFMRNIVDQIVQHGHVIRGSLGFSGTGLEGEVRSPNAAWQMSAVKVTGLDPNGAALKAGLQVDDYITHLNGEMISGVTDLLQRVATTKPGSLLKIRVRRGDQMIELNAVVQEREQ
jgi:serine protease DegS